MSQIAKSTEAAFDPQAAGEAPDSDAMLEIMMAHALGLAMLNAVSAQQNAAIVRGAVVTAACTALLSLSVAEQPGAPSSATAGSASAAAAQSADPQSTEALARIQQADSTKLAQYLALSAGIAAQDAVDAQRARAILALAASAAGTLRFLETGNLVFLRLGGTAA